MTIQQLEHYGANTKDGLRRCLDSEEFYLKMVKMFCENNALQTLYDAVESGDLAAAFDAAHSLKGSTANLALDPLFRPLSELTELLRARTQMDYTEMMAQIKAAQTALEAICAE